jgi:protocatechuate 4,5-dioxygenase alpha subunit
MREQYLGIPGTTVFDGQQSRRGYHLNQFCMSLLIPANRDQFKADEETYLSKWNLADTQKLAVLRRDYNAMIAEGGNIYFLRKRHSELPGQPAHEQIAADAMAATGRRSVAPGPLRSLQRHTRCRVWTSI